MGKKIESVIIVRLGKLFLPFVIGVSIIITIGILLDGNLRLKFWSLITGYFFPPLGKETIIPAGVAIGISPIIMALSIAFIDAIVALFLVWNYDLAKEIPFIGKFITKVEEKGKNVEDKYGWVKPLRFLGIVLFVMVPFQGSGGLVGSILGRLIGMKPWNTFFAISIGAIIGCILIAMFSQAFIIFAQINSTITIIIVIIIIFILIMYYFFKKRKKNK